MPGIYGDARFDGKTCRRRDWEWTLQSAGAFYSSLLLHYLILLFLFTCFNAILLPLPPHYSPSSVTYVSAEIISDLFSTIYPNVTGSLAYGKCLINPCQVKESINEHVSSLRVVGTQESISTEKSLLLFPSHILDAKVHSQF